MNGFDGFHNALTFPLSFTLLFPSCSLPFPCPAPCRPTSNYMEPTIAGHEQQVGQGRHGNAAKDTAAARGLTTASSRTCNGDNDELLPRESGDLIGQRYGEERAMGGAATRCRRWWWNWRELLQKKEMAAGGRNKRGAKRFHGRNIKPSDIRRSRLICLP